MNNKTLIELKCPMCDLGDELTLLSSMISPTLFSNSREERWECLNCGSILKVTFKLESVEKI
jgi:uncharacterized Zn finger protein